MNMYQYLKPTPILDYNSKKIHELVSKRFAFLKGSEEKAEKIYYFVRDEIGFGFNKSDHIPASKVLIDGYGQCNTKTNLFIALCRAVNIPCRAHFFKINKKIQKGLFPSRIYSQHLKEEIIHSWPKVNIKDRWISLEGIILDKDYLLPIKNRFHLKNEFEGFGVSVNDLANISTDWSGKDTFVQKESIIKDEGIYPCPDYYYDRCGANISVLKEFMFKCIVRHLVNRRVKNIRMGRW